MQDNVGTKSKIPDLPKRLGPDDKPYGYEWSIRYRENFDEEVDRFVRSRQMRWPFRPVRPAILECGGGSGFRAWQMARLGAEVWNIDFSSSADEVLLRNGQIEGPGSVHWLPYDARVLDSVELPKRNWSMVHARLLTHFWKRSQIERWISFLPSISNAKTTLALLYARDICGSGALIDHDPENIANMLERHRYKITFRNVRHRQNGTVECVFFAKIPGLQPIL